VKLNLYLKCVIFVPLLPTSLLSP